VVVALTACSFRPGSPTGGGDDVNPGEMVAMIGEPDFSGTLVDGLLAPGRNVLEPDAFAFGGLHAISYSGDQLNDASTYANTINNLGAVVGFGYRQVPTDWMGDRPHGLGLASSDTFTVSYDGEIQLSAGQHMLSVDADDRAIVQVATDGVTFS